eukprot:8453296-Prorocentrum_lima.AAC.1
MSKANVDVVLPWSKQVVQTTQIIVGFPQESVYHASVGGVLFLQQDFQVVETIVCSCANPRVQI